MLDPVVVPTSSFAASAVAWITTVTFFLVSLVVATGLAIGGLVLFLFLELLALLAYAYPGVLFLLSVAGGVAPAVIAYWVVHASFGVDVRWTTWMPFALIVVGLWGSYYYWRFARVVSTTGESVLAVYRGAAPKARELFGAPVAVLAGIRDLIAIVLGVFRGVAGELFTLLLRRFGSPARGSDASAPGEADDSALDDPGPREERESDR